MGEQILPIYDNIVNFEWKVPNLIGEFLAAVWIIFGVSRNDIGSTSRSRKH